MGKKSNSKKDNQDKDWEKRHPKTSPIIPRNCPLTGWQVDSNTSKDHVFFGHSSKPHGPNDD